MDSELKLWVSLGIAFCVLMLGVATCTASQVHTKSVAFVDCVKAGGSATDCSLGIERVH